MTRVAAAITYFFSYRLEFFFVFSSGRRPRPRWRWWWPLSSPGSLPVSSLLPSSSPPLSSSSKRKVLSLPALSLSSSSAFSSSRRALALQCHHIYGRRGMDSIRGTGEISYRERTRAGRQAGRQACHVQAIRKEGRHACHVRKGETNQQPRTREKKTGDKRHVRASQHRSHDETRHSRRSGKNYAVLLYVEQDWCVEHLRPMKHEKHGETAVKSAPQPNERGDSPTIVKSYQVPVTPILRSCIHVIGG